MDHLFLTLKIVGITLLVLFVSAVLQWVMIGLLQIRGQKDKRLRFKLAILTLAVLSIPWNLIGGVLFGPGFMFAFYEVRDVWRHLFLPNKAIISTQ